jgi:hypothetical protein
MDNSCKSLAGELDFIERLEDKLMVIDFTMRDVRLPIF